MTGPAAGETVVWKAVLSRGLPGRARSRARRNVCLCVE